MFAESLRASVNQLTKHYQVNATFRIKGASFREFDGTLTTGDDIYAWTGRVIAYEDTTEKEATVVGVRKRNERMFTFPRGGKGGAKIPADAIADTSRMQMEIGTAVWQVLEIQTHAGHYRAIGEVAT